MYDDLKNINQTKEIKSKISDIIDLYNYINSNYDISNEMKMIYKSQKAYRLKIFGRDFVKNNKNKCYLIIN